MTHKDLVKKAKLWLKKIEKCTIVIAEKSNGAEIPDTIGYKSARHSVLIECKTSRSDFRADADKWFRQEGLGMGQTRYFMAPAGIIPIDELPVGWGLLEVDSSTVHLTKKCDLVCIDEMRSLAEIPLLTAVIRKLQWSNYLLRKAIKQSKTTKSSSKKKPK